MQKSIVILQENYTELKAFFEGKPDFTVAAATENGKEGLAIIESIKPDVIICDLILKELDGLTLLEKISELKLDARIVVYSAFDSDEIIRSACTHGASLYLVKPLSPEILYCRITDLISQEPIQTERERLAELRISNVFLAAGIPPHIKGYGFLRSGVKLAIKDPAILGNITKKLYPMIAKEYSTSPSKVERAIRHAIEVAWNRGRIEALNSIFGVSFYQSGDKPTNSEFIALVADRLIQEIHLGKLNRK